MASAAPRTAADALQIAKQFALQTTALRPYGNMQMTLSSSATAQAKMRGKSSATPYYVVNLDNNNGFIIVSGDDRFRPVLGYTTSGSLNDGDSMPDGLSYWLDFLSEEMSAAIENGYEGAEAAPRAASDIYSESIAPLIKTKWGQTAPFNNKIPNYATGCVATGMAQVMKYWNYPTRGIGTHTNPNFPTYTADFGATVYDWANMKDVYGGKYDTKAEIDAVSTLMLHLGISTDMLWTSDNSGTSKTYSAYSLINFFGYNKNLHTESRDHVSLGAWKALIIDQLSTGHPLCYSGMTDDTHGAGHYFVLDGYDAETGKFHFNWGWSGAFDGYFDITALEPGGAGQAGALTGSYNYNQHIFVDVQPDECGEPTSMFEAVKIYPLSMTCTKNKVEFNTYSLEHNAVNFKGTIGLAIYNADGTLYNYVASTTAFPAGLMLGASFKGNQAYAVDLSNVGDGTYTVCLATLRDDLPNKPFPVRATYNNVTYYTMTVAGNSVTFAEQTSSVSVSDNAAPVVLNPSEPNTAYENHTATFEITIKNTGTTAFFDEVGVSIKKNSREKTPQYIMTPCSLAPGEEKTIRVSGKIVRTPDTYTLYTCVGDNGTYRTLTNTTAITIKDEQSAIASVTVDNVDAPVYTLSGLRVKNGDNLPSGIYIKNGKKLMVK